MVKLVSVYRDRLNVQFLYDLLLEREASESISHKSMPTLPEHAAFVHERPYACWYVVENNEGEKVGTVYISKQRELGISILKAHRRKGYARQALKAIMDRWPGRFLANVNPENVKSIDLFVKLGFVQLQVTYERR